MRDVPVGCTRITQDVPTPIAGRIYSEACLDRMVEQSNSLADRGAMFVTLDYPAYGNRNLSQIIGSAFNFSVFRGRISATMRLLDTTQGLHVQKMLDLDKPFFFMPYCYALVGNEHRVAAESLMLRGWYLEAAE